jgi:hypothetical protein
MTGPNRQPSGHEWGAGGFNRSECEVLRDKIGDFFSSEC